jgi:hypothetical protein
VLEHLEQVGRVVVMGADEDLQAANQARPGWLNVIKVL